MMELINQFQAMTVTQLREVVSVIDNVISEKLNRLPNTDHATQNNVANINDYVNHFPDFISDTDSKLLLGELASLQLGSGKSLNLNKTSQKFPLLSFHLSRNLTSGNLKLGLSEMKP